MFTIEKNIPIPYAPPSSYPFEAMAVGDSFAVPLEGSEYASLDSMKSSVSKFARLYSESVNEEKSFTIRTFKDKSQIRIWRVK
jgi:hypothetical protein